MYKYNLTELTKLKQYIHIPKIELIKFLAG